MPVGLWISNDEPKDVMGSFSVLCGECWLLTLIKIDEVENIMSKKPFAEKTRLSTSTCKSLLLPPVVELTRLCHRFHGLAAARANLDDPDNKARYVQLPPRGMLMF